MLMLGSIGFHRVTKDATGVLNTTERVRLKPLAAVPARSLALRRCFRETPRSRGCER